MTALEGRASVLRMLRSALDERSVFLWIGGENPQPELRSVSVVGANYGLGHRNLGSVGVVGPLRMDYATRDRLGARGRARAVALLRDRLRVLDPADAARLLRGARRRPGRLRKRRSRRRFAASPASCTPTSTPTTPRRRRSSRRPRRPTRCCPTPSSGGPTTASGTRACGPAAGRPAAPASARSRTSSTPSSAAARRSASGARGPLRRRRRRGGGRDHPRRRPDRHPDARSSFDAVGVCEHCRGNGAEPGTPIRTCERCGGAGQLRQVTRTPFGQMVRAAICDACGGDGRIAETPCSSCGGSGRTAGAKQLEVEVPAGIESGQRVRITGAGHAGEPGGRAGDLYVEVRVADDQRFHREGDDLVAVVGVAATDAMLGTSIEVETLDGRRQVEVAAGTQPGTEAVLRGLGLPRLGGGRRGDQRIIFNVIVPANLSEEQRQLAGRLGETLGPDNLAEDAAAGSSPACAAPSAEATTGDDPARGSLPSRAGRAGPRRAHGAGAERGRGGARARIRRVRDLRRRGRAARPRPARGGSRRRRWSRSRPPRSPTTGPTAGRTSTSRCWSAIASGCGHPGSRGREGAVDVVVDPGRAFGTGAHPTTRLCLELLLELEAAKAGPLTDLGTGSGVLAIAAAKLGWEPGARLRPRAGSPGGGSRQRGRERGRDRASARRTCASELPPLAPTVVANLTAPVLRADRRRVCAATARSG